MSAKRIPEVLVPLPPLPQRRRIEELAQQIHEARTLRKQASEEAEALSYASLRQVRNQLLNSGYPKSRLGAFTNVTSGGIPSRDNAAFWNGDIPRIKTGELLDGDISKAEEHITQSAAANSSAKLFPPDTVLIALYGQGQTRSRTARLLIPATTTKRVAPCYQSPISLNRVLFSFGCAVFTSSFAKKHKGERNRTGVAR